MEAGNSKSKSVEYCSVRPEPEVHKQPRRPKAQIPTQSDTLYSSGGNYRLGTRLPSRGSDQAGSLLHTHDPIAHLPGTGDGYRFILNLKRLNSHITTESFKIESPNCSRPGSSKRLDGQGRSKRSLLRSPRSTGESRSLLLKKEWSLNSQVFESLTGLWGQPTIDLFASCQNRKAKKYFSRGYETTAMGQNALSRQNPWPSSALLYAYPPENLISRTLQKLEEQKVHRLILIAPAWKTRPWYPLLLEKVVDIPRCLPNWENLILDPISCMV